MADGTLSLQDIANLARVRRPVVSMWRRRPTVRGSAIPFPEPVARVDGMERFDREAVVSWLEATGRGNNAEARQDAPGLSVPEGAELEDIVVLLCLYALAGEELAALSSAELTELAERVDPHDELLLSEVRDLAGSAPLQRYVDDLVEASFGLGDALDRVEAGRLRRAASERGLNIGVVKIVRAVAQACQTHLGGDAVAVAPHGDPALAEGLTGGFAGLLLDDDHPAARSHRRRARLREVDVLADAHACVRVLSVVGLDATPALDAIDELTLSLGRADAGVVLGPASVLCDRLDGQPEHDRADTLRSEPLAIAMRLSRGMWKGSHRQHLGLWVLRGGRNGQRFYAADLDGLPLDHDDLAADVVAALEQTEKRAYRYARRGELALVLTGASPVVARGVRALQAVTAAQLGHLDAIHAASLVTSQSLRGYDIAAAPAASRIVLRQRSLRELVDAGHLTLRRGGRIDPGHASAEGTVRVLAADGSSDDIRLDPIDAERYYPRAVRTEPGDVVFTDRPRPAARVDEQGGALVASPSRILRLKPAATIGPHALAALINEIAEAGTEWETWSVPDLPSVEARALDAALRAAAKHLRDLREQEHAMRDLTMNLIQGVAAGAVTIDPTITEKAG